jgi:hypothetical protein
MWLPRDSRCSTHLARFCSLDRLSGYDRLGMLGSLAPCPPGPGRARRIDHGPQNKDKNALGPQDPFAQFPVRHWSSTVHAAPKATCGLQVMVVGSQDDWGRHSTVFKHGAPSAKRGMQVPLKFEGSSGPQ